MNFFQRIMQRFSGSKSSDWKGKQFDFTDWFGRTFGGRNNSTLETNETIFSIVTRLSNMLASLPFKEYKKYDEQSGTDVADLLVNPNDNISGFTMISQLEVSRNRDGNGYALIERDKTMAPIAMFPIPANYVTPMVDQDSGELYYQVTGKDKNMIVHNSDMIHVRHIMGPESYVGISPISVLKNALDFDNAVASFSLSEMDKVDTFVLTYGSNVSDEKRKQITNNFEKFRQYNGGVLFQEPGVTIDRLDRNFEMGDITDSDKITRTRIANAFNVPLSFVNDSSGTGVNSNEQLMTQFVQMTLSPITKQYETEFNRKLLTRNQRKQGYYFKFNLNALMRGDITSRSAYYQMAKRNGILTSNDIRALEDVPLSSDPNADKLVESGDLYPIDMDPAQRKGVTTSDEQESSTDGSKEQEVLGNEKDK
ncbi:phage portal protein [Pediococcus inopinatus]|uniref:phage portal protein n=1 Tax=Pediococcus inopinatus TaxID=114090 RepID=UPI002B259F09|nr:phage portal protein [Pediococcus inopinatus]WPC19428.1 phage portal protein [Pediococcus inopinatus]